eukprot:scaffold397469_cov26-Prasinocladus_malaysianus.AAC.2
MNPIQACKQAHPREGGDEYLGDEVVDAEQAGQPGRQGHGDGGREGAPDGDAPGINHRGGRGRPHSIEVARGACWRHTARRRVAG